MNRVEQVTSFVLVPQADLDILKATQLQILEVLKTLQLVSSKASPPPPAYLTAVEFMRAVKICRSKFDQLAATGKVKVIKKKRKLYVPLSEVERYFTDPSVV
jgi:hypothetical protein